MNKTFQNFFVGFLILGALFFAPKSVLASGGILSYDVEGDVNTTMQEAMGSTGATTLSSSWLSNLAGPTTGRWNIVRSSPVRQEFISAKMDNQSLVVETCLGDSNNCATSSSWSSSSPSRGFAATISTTGQFPAYDVTYDSTGRAILVYRSGLQSLSYYLWDGSSWSGPSTVTNSDYLAQNINFVRLFPRPNSRDVIVLFSTAADDIGGILWNGSSWSTTLSSSACTSLSGSSNNAFPFSGAWLQSGSKFIGACTHVSSFPTYFTYTPGVGFSSASNITTSVTALNVIDLFPNPIVDLIGVAGMTFSGTNATVYANIWDESQTSWISESTIPGGRNPAISGTTIQPISGAWYDESNAIVAYAAADEATDSLHALKWNGTWTTAHSGSMTTNQAWNNVQAIDNQGNNQLLVFAEDNSAAANLYGFSWNGSSWARVGSNPIDANLDSYGRPFFYAHHPPKITTSSLSGQTTQTTAGGKSITIPGRFFASSTVTIGGTAATITSQTSSSIVVTAPANSAGVYDLVVSNSVSGKSSTCVGCITYITPPSSISISDQFILATTTPQSRNLFGSNISTSSCPVKVAGTCVTSASFSTTTTSTFSGALSSINPTASGAISAGYATAGYSFVPKTNGYITALGANIAAASNRSVRLWNSSGTELASASVSANNTWGYTAISPVAVTAGQTYWVGVYAGSAGNVVRTFSKNSLVSQASQGIILTGGYYSVTFGTLSVLPTSGNTVYNPAEWYGADVKFEGNFGATNEVNFNLPNLTAGQKTVRVYGPQGDDSNGIYTDLSTGFITYSDLPPTSATTTNNFIPANTTGTQRTITSASGGLSTSTCPLSIGGNCAVYISGTSSSITVSMPSSTPGLKTMRLYGVGGSDTNFIYRDFTNFWVYAPVVSSVTPSTTLSTIGGETVTVTGFGLKVGSQGAKIDPNGTADYVTTTGTSTSITFTTPAHASGTYPLRVYGSSGSDANNVYEQSFNLTYIPPGYNQTSYRWFQNTDTTTPGSPLAAQNTSSSYSSFDEVLRLRVTVNVQNASSPVGDSFKLQVATTSAACSAGLSNYADVSSSTGAIRLYNNPSVSSGASLVATSTDPTDGSTKTNQSYVESNNFQTISTIASGTTGMWDFPLINISGSRGATYCFRIVKSDGAVFGSYTNIPTITIPNIQPEVQNVIASQNSSGTVVVSYEARDRDTNVGGAAIPNAVSPSFEYWNGSSWTVITSSTLGAGDTGNKAVVTSTYTQHTASWSAKNQVNGFFSTSSIIRVTVSDGEVANSTSSAQSSALIIDTTNPTSTTFIFDSRANELSLAATDSSNLEYILSNNPDLSSDGTNASSGQWISVGANSVNTTSSWTPTGTPSYEKVYYGVRDVYGNTVTSTMVAPSKPVNIAITDITNTNAGFYGESITWSAYTATTSAALSVYEIYRSTTGSSTGFSLIASTTDIVYSQSGLNPATTYHYKVSVKTTQGNYSEYSDVVTDRPDGLGVTSNVAPSFDTGFDSIHQTGAVAVQVATTTDSDWGKIKISYRVKDADSTSTIITPSFEYDIGAGWVSIPSSTLASGDTDSKTISSSSYTTFTATWTASSQLASTYVTNLQVRVTATDGQSSGQATSFPITLDTTTPTITSSTLVVNGYTASAQATSSGAYRIQIQNITGSPTDEGGYLFLSNDGVSYYQLFANGTIATTSNTVSGSTMTLNTATLSPLSWTWTQGGSTLYFYAIDAYNNRTATTSVSIIGINDPPEFQSFTASQATSSDPTQGGYVTMNYSIRDSDSTSVTPTFAYSLNGGGWTTISSSSMNSTSTSAKSVASSTYTDYTAIWYGTTTVTSTYSSNLAIRLIVDDGQAVNNTASSSATITFDSKGPTLSSSTLLVNGSSTAVESVSSSVTLSLQEITGTPTGETVYVQFSDDGSTWYGANANGTLAASSSWGNGFASDSGTLSVISWPWTLSSRSRTIYARVTDALGNSIQTDTNSVGYNVTPEFNSGFGTNGLSVSQISSASSSDWGKVSIQYNIRDTDTASGSSTPGYVTPSFEYSVGFGWFSIATSSLAAGDTSNKVVDPSSYTTYTATWNASSQLASTYSTALQIRATINDNESVSNTAQATSSQITFDSKSPSTTVQIDGRVSRVIVTASDDTSIDYALSNASSLIADGSNASSGSWTVTGASSTNTSSSWTLTGSVLNTVYYGARDTLGNTITGSVSVPVAPASTSITDVSDTATTNYKELISWTAYTSTSTAPFSKYEVYRATNSDPTNFSLVGTVTDISQNYYTDTGLSSSTTYYYKVSIVTTGGSYSAYGSTVSDQPDGLSGAAAVGPTISNVQAAEVQASWARITWDTDRVSDSKVEYAASSSTPYSLSTSTITLVTSHDVYIGDLTPNTTYSFRVVSKDVNNKESTTNGADFTTLGGPIISAVTTESVTDHTASIIWNTNKDSDSIVVYSTSLQNLRDGTSTLQAGNTSLVGSPFQHRVTLSGLNTQTIYYYYVKSTDASANISTDKNNGNYYTFSTAQDTKPPVISNIAVPAVTKNSAVVTWQTDELANSQMTYDTFSASSTGQTHRNTTNLDDTMTSNHAVTITGLSASTAYYFYVKSIDAAGNLTTSAEQQLTTSDSDTPIISVSGGGAPVAPTDTVLKDSTPPTISNIVISNITPFSARVDFDTDEEAIGFVSFGETPDYTRNPGEPSFRTHHTLNLVNLKLGTTYHFSIKASDRAGNFTTTADDTFITKFAVESAGDIAKLENVEQYQDQIDTLIESVTPSLITPFIGKIEVTELTDNSAIIKWTTNTKTYGSVLYVADKDYDEKKDNPYLAEVSDTQGKVTTHQVQLNNLSPGQLYHYKIKSYTLPNVVGGSTDKTFITKASKIRPDIVRLFNTSFVVTWQTSKKTTSFVEYTNTKTKQIAQSGNDASVTAHVVNVENLSPDTTYRVRAFGYDENKNIVESETITVTTKKDITPPTISNMKIDNTFVPGRNDRIQTVISWKTNEPASSLVLYGEGSTASQKQLPNVASSTDSTALSLNHNVIITNFKPGTIYQMQVVSLDGAGNRAASPVRVIITPKQTQSVFDVIVKNFEGTFKFINQ